ncbi:hypothetical protein QTP88_014806 [Uroleucon formosanum]
MSFSLNKKLHAPPPVAISFLLDYRYDSEIGSRYKWRIINNYHYKNNIRSIATKEQKKKEGKEGKKDTGSTLRLCGHAHSTTIRRLDIAIRLPAGRYCGKCTAALLAHMADSTTPFHSFLLKSLASCSPSLIPQQTTFLKLLTYKINQMMGKGVKLLVTPKNRQIKKPQPLLYRMT